MRGGGGTGVGVVIGGEITMMRSVRRSGDGGQGHHRETGIVRGGASTGMVIVQDRAHRREGSAGRRAETGKETTRDIVEDGETTTIVQGAENVNEGTADQGRHTREGGTRTIDDVQEPSRYAIAMLSLLLDTPESCPHSLVTFPSSSKPPYTAQAPVLHPTLTKVSQSC